MIHYIDKFPDRIAITQNGTFLYFGGTAYLGLQTHRAFQEITINNIKRYGTHYGASRVSNIRFSIYEQAEHYLARHIGSESCITLSSGFMASQLVSRYFIGSSYRSYLTPHSHESLSAPEHVKLNSYKDLSIALKELTVEQTPVIYLDAIDFMGLNYPEFKTLQSVNLKNCILVVDDSHGLGIVGKHGEGVFKSLEQLDAKEVIVCGSLGKGFGLPMGGVFGFSRRIEDLKRSNIFGGSSPASPASMATLLESQSIVNHQRKKLYNNLQLFRGLLKTPELFMHFGDHPTFTFLDDRLTTYLYQNKIIVTSFNYPTPDAPLMSRIVLSAYHTASDIETLATVINRYKKTS